MLSALRPWPVSLKGGRGKAGWASAMGRLVEVRTAKKSSANWKKGARTAKALPRGRSFLGVGERHWKTGGRRARNSDSRTMHCDLAGRGKNGHGGDGMHTADIGDYSTRIFCKAGEGPTSLPLSLRWSARDRLGSLCAQRQVLVHEIVSDARAWAGAWRVLTLRGPDES